MARPTRSKRSSSKQRASARVITSRFLNFLTEWGGAATLLIAILYTFPFDACDSLDKWLERDVTTARQALSDAASIWIEQAKTTNQLGDPSAQDVLNRSYQSKFFNVVYLNREALSNAVPDLKIHEVQQIASLLALIGQASDALPLFDEAIAKAKRDNVPYANILRDKAQALFQRGWARDIEEARIAYREAIRLTAEARPPDPRTHVIFITELAYWELLQGDWACGQQLKAAIDSPLRTLASFDAISNNQQAMFQRSVGLLRQRTGQANAGCPYTIDTPQLPSSSLPRALDRPPCRRRRIERNYFVFLI